MPSLIKDRLWLTESLGGESDAMSKKNLWWSEDSTRSAYRQKILYTRNFNPLAEDTIAGEQRGHSKGLSKVLCITLYRE